MRLTQTECRAGTLMSGGTSKVEMVCTNMSSAPDRIAGRAMRSVIVRNVRSGEQPEASAASSRDESIEVNDAVPMRYAIGMMCIDWTNTMPGSEYTLNWGRCT